MCSLHKIRDFQTEVACDLTFTACEGKPHAIMVFFGLSFPRKRESRDFYDQSEFPLSRSLLLPSAPGLGRLVLCGWRNGRVRAILALGQPSGAMLWGWHRTLFQRTTAPSSLPVEPDPDKLSPMPLGASLIKICNFNNFDHLRSSLSVNSRSTPEWSVLAAPLDIRMESP